MPFDTRVRIVEAIKYVDWALPFDDSDGSAIKFIEQIQQTYPNDEIIFANGGDRTQENIPEMVCRDVKFEFGVGGDFKANSSSWILDKYAEYVMDAIHPVTARVWGEYKVLEDMKTIKSKLLKVRPGQSLSYQRHSKRNEFWVVWEGVATVIS